MIIYKSLSSTSHLDKAATVDICIDLIGFLRLVFLINGILNKDLDDVTSLTFYDAEVVELAILSILRYVLIGGEAMQHLVSAFASALHQDVVDIFSQII